MDEFAMAELGLFAGLMGLIAFIIGVLIFAPFYILLCLGLQKMAQKNGIEPSWIAWIPVAQFYIVGKIIKTLRIFNFDVPSVEIVLPLSVVANMLFQRVPLIGFLVFVVMVVVNIFALNKLYKMYAPENATLFTILSCFLLFPILIFIIRNKEPVNLP